MWHARIWSVDEVIEHTQHVTEHALHDIFICSADILCCLCWFWLTCCVFHSSISCPGASVLVWLESFALWRRQHSACEDLVMLMLSTVVLFEGIPCKELSAEFIETTRILCHALQCPFNAVGRTSMKFHCFMQCSSNDDGYLNIHHITFPLANSWFPSSLRCLMLTSGSYRYVYAQQCRFPLYCPPI